MDNRANITGKQPLLQHVFEKKQYLPGFGFSGDQNVAFGWPRNSAPFRFRFPELLAPPGTRAEAGTMAGAAEVSSLTLGVLVPGCLAPGIGCRPI